MNGINSVTVTVKLKSRSEEYDLEIPINMTIKIVISAINRFFSVKKNIENKSPKYITSVEYQSKILNPDETLEDAGIWDGSVLTLIES